ncbi:uncharacterized protein LOC106694888, partial [Myotis lucifugus]|uniref:uncharacterized protein LOC106694888 n=1 Tax=Myotis lucifugus TaxID=59463 RepID=UPI000CCBE8BC
AQGDLAGLARSPPQISITRWGPSPTESPAPARPSSSAAATLSSLDLLLGAPAPLGGVSLHLHRRVWLPQRGGGGGSAGCAARVAGAAQGQGCRAPAHSLWPHQPFLLPLSFPSHTTNPFCEGVASLEGRPKGAGGTGTRPGSQAAAPARLIRPWRRWTGSSSVCFWRRTRTSTCSGCRTTSPWPDGTRHTLTRTDSPPGPAGPRSQL